jgi:serine/threonine-protein kinase
MALEKERAVPQPPSSIAQLPVGTVLAQRYRIERLIGSGGYANVYHGTDLKSGEDRAIKEVVDSDPGVRRQFQLEAGLLIHSTHPNIPRGYQLLEEKGRLYLVMEFVRGRDLEDLLNESLVQRGRPLDEEQVLRLALEICGALDEMHHREPPVIHRDIKPANIKITPEGKPVLIDFGLAKLQTSGPTRTAAQGVSPGFAPPEQYMAKGKTDARSDVYGLGATLYASLTGKDPPEAPSRLMAQTGTAGQALVAPRTLAKDHPISELTNRVIIKTLELSPTHRHQSAANLADDLHVALRRIKGDTGALTSATIVCQLCGKQTAADAPRCQHCGRPPRPATIGAAAAQSTARRPIPPAVAPPSAKPPPGSGGLGQQPPGSGGLGKPSPGGGALGNQPPGSGGLGGAQRVAKPLAAPAQVNRGSSSGFLLDTARQSAARPAAQMGAGQMPAGQMPAPTTTQHASLGVTRTREERAVAGRVAGGVAGGVAGALALAPRPTTAATAVAEPAPPPPARPRAQPKAPALDPLVIERPRSWLNLKGPELSSFGKFALACSAVEAAWGILLVALGAVVMTRGAAERPYVLLALIWFAGVIVLVLLGWQVLRRPVFRRGRLSKLRRGFQGFGLTAYALAIHAVALWGVYVFSQAHPSLLLMQVAFLLFAVNVLVAGTLSLANTLG